MVELLINAGADINNIEDEDGDSLLVSAIYNGDKEMVKMLIKNGADVNKPNHYNDNDLGLLTHAIKLINYKPGSKEIVKMLIEKGALNMYKSDFNYALKVGKFSTKDLYNFMKADKTTRKSILDFYKSTNKIYDLLIMAIEEGDKEILKFLIENGVLLDSSLYSAVLNGDKEMVKMLIENGVDVNKKDEYNETALQGAVMRGYNEIAQILIENGADVNHISEPGDYTILDSAIRYPKNEEMVKMLIENGAVSQDLTPLNTAVMYAEIPWIKNLIKKGVDINKKDQYDKTVLMTAIEIGDKEIVKILIENGADVNLKSDLINDEIALMYALQEGDKEIVKMLIDAGTDINKTALEYASKADNIVKMLIDAKRSRYKSKK